MNYGDYGFGVPEGKYTWDEGKAKCESMGSHLAYIKTPEDQQAAKAYLDSIWDPSQCGGKGNLDSIWATWIVYWQPG